MGIFDNKDDKDDNICHQNNHDPRWEYLSTRADYSINVRPHPMMLGKALADYVAKVDDDDDDDNDDNDDDDDQFHDHFQVGWQSLVVLYEHDEGLVRLQELLRLPQVIILLIEIVVVKDVLIQKTQEV